MSGSLDAYSVAWRSLVRTVRSVLVLAFLTLGCAPPEDAEKRAEAAIEQHFDARRADDDGVLDTYAEEFYRSVARVEWAARLDSIEHLVGLPRHFQEKEGMERVQDLAFGRQWRYRAFYAVDYDRGHGAEHMELIVPRQGPAKIAWQAVSVNGLKADSRISNGAR